MIFVILYGAGRRTSVENKKFIKFSISAGTYLIDDFNAKMKAAVLQERQDWIPPQILNLVIPEHYTLMASHNLFIALGILDKYLEITTQIKSALPHDSYKTTLVTSPLPIILSLHCKQISKVKSELDGEPSGLIARMHVSNCKATFASLHDFRIRHA